MAKEIETLYVEHHQWLKKWLNSRLSCPWLAADLMQDTFERLLRRSDKKQDYRQPRAYLTRIAKGLVIDHWRRREIEQAYIEALAAQPEADVICEQTRYELLETLVWIDRALNRLPTRTRQVFLRVQLEGVKYRLLADEFGVSERTIKADVAKAMLACIEMEAE